MRQTVDEPTGRAARPIPTQCFFAVVPDDALLTASEERALAEAIARGDAEARARLIRGNLRLVMRIARDYRGRGLAIEDLIGEGNLGLIRAVTDFDPAYGVRFSTYAAYWIKQAIRHALTTTGATIRLPAHMVNRLARWKRTEHSLERRLGRDPSFEEVADALELSPSRRDLIGRALRARQVVRDSGDPDGDASWEGDEAEAPFEAPEAAIEADEERTEALRRLEVLEEREQLVVRLRFGLGGGEPMSLQEIGNRLGITREWVRKLEQRAIQKLEGGQATTPARSAAATRARRRAPGRRPVPSGRPYDRQVAMPA